MESVGVLESSLFAVWINNQGVFLLQPRSVNWQVPICNWLYAIRVITYFQAGKREITCFEFFQVKTFLLFYLNNIFLFILQTKYSFPFLPFPHLPIHFFSMKTFLIIMLKIACEATKVFLKKSWLCQINLPSQHLNRIASKRLAEFFEIILLSILPQT